MTKQHASGKSNTDKAVQERGLEQAFDGEATPPHPEKRRAPGNGGQKTHPDDEKHDDQDFFETKT